MRRTLAVIFLTLSFASGCAVRPAVVRSPAAERFGVLVMAHGGDATWNREVEASLVPLREKFPLEIAFGMADAMSLESAVRRLENQGVARIAVVRLFISGESWYERTEQILGLKPGAPAKPNSPERTSDEHALHGGHSMAFWRIASKARFALSRDGLMDAPEMGEVLADRARALSRDPSHEDVLILAHGPEDDSENERWIAKIDARADAVRRAAPFRRVRVQTLREDWPEKREAAEERIRAFVDAAERDGGKALVIPYRLQGFGPYAKVLEGHRYVSDGRGLVPHARVGAWVARQAAAQRLSLSSPAEVAATP